MFKHFNHFKNTTETYSQKYVSTSQSSPLEEKSILLEAAQGKNINGNMFALLRELKTDPKWTGFKVYFVATSATKPLIQKRLKDYGFKGVEILVRDTTAYAIALATAKYLFTDNSFPIYFVKREGQICVNTWHGTPIKYLGTSDIDNAISLTNLQKNFYASDYMLFPNSYTMDIFTKDYNLENIFTGKNLLADYPRNDVLQQTDKAVRLREKLSLNSKELIAYMPTWRGAGRSADKDIQKMILVRFFDELDKILNDNQIFYVNLHFLVGSIIDLSVYNHIRPFPEEYETYDFLSICDCLVTDYSSVMFDYAVTGKKILIYAYDLEEYIENKGLYFPITDLPFPISKNVNQLAEHINEEFKMTREYEKFIQSFAKYASPNASSNLLELVLSEKTFPNNIMEILPPKDNGKPNLLLHCGRPTNIIAKYKVYSFVEELMAKNLHLDNNIIISFEGGMIPETIDFIKGLPLKCAVIPLPKARHTTLEEEQILSYYELYDSKPSNHDEIVTRVAKREKDRLFYNLKVHELIYYIMDSENKYHIFTTFKCPKSFYIQSPVTLGKKTFSKYSQALINDSKLHFDQVIDDKDTLIDEGKYNYSSVKPSRLLNSCMLFANQLSLSYNTSGAINLLALAKMTTTLDVNFKDAMILVEDLEIKPFFLFKKGIPIGDNSYLNIYKFSIKNHALENMRLYNKVRFSIYGPKLTKNLHSKEGIIYGFSNRIMFSENDSKSSFFSFGGHKIIEKTQTTAIFKSVKANYLSLMVRKTNQTDYMLNRIKLLGAYIISKFKKTKGSILLFEKETARYEESASVLYEKLIDKGYKNAYFVLDKNYPHINRIEKKYLNNIIWKNTFKHYYHFFSSNNFISTEVLSHVIDLRTVNKRVMRKLNSSKVKYIFLQHGVMYMISLDSPTRKFFLKSQFMKNKKSNFKILVSSELEAEHFVTLGGYSTDDLYIAGLPKFDKSHLNDNADKIAIMPTWRPWEYNQIRSDCRSTVYFKMLENIVDAVPEHLKEKIVIMPHPLIAQSLRDTSEDIGKYIVDEDTKYDDILKDTSLLITDYSSIAYDAFYRGSTVIFYWEMKDDAMAKYGEGTKLMLNEENAFGNISMNKEKLSTLIQRDYNSPPSQEFNEKYSKIVAFKDGKNTERLIEFMKRDKFI